MFGAIALLSLSALATLGSAYDIGCVYPATMPEPFTAATTLTGTLSVFAQLIKMETPAVVNIAHLSSVAQANCLAYHDNTALNVLTHVPTPFPVPPHATNAWSRTLCMAQSFKSAAYTLFPGVRVLDDVLESWGLDDATMPAWDPAFLQCNGDAACLAGLLLPEYHPFLVGQLVAAETLKFFQNDGWNSDGAKKWDYRTESVTDCTASCRPYSDTIGYVPENVAGYCRKHTNENNKYKVEGCNKRWQPLLEDNGAAFFYRQEHVTPHIGFTGHYYALDGPDAVPELDEPDYDYKDEADLVIERLKELASDQSQKDAVDFYDNKLWVRAIIQDKMLKEFAFTRQHSFEDHMMFIHGLSISENDALLAAWHQKVTHDLVRPTTVIQRWGDDDLFTFDGNRASTAPANIKAKDFQPYKRVMPHSEFPSGSSALCSSYAEFTDKFTQTEYSRTLGVMETGSSTPLQYNVGCGTSLEGRASIGCAGDPYVKANNMTHLAYVCGQSRLWGGMHFTASIQGGIDVAAGIGTKAYDVVTNIQQNTNWGTEYFLGDSRPVCSSS